MKNNPLNRQDWIFDLLKVDPVTYGEMYSKYSKMFGRFSQMTFTKDWKKANDRYQSYKNKVNTEKEKQSIHLELKTEKGGLKSKFQRLMTLQNRLENLETKLDSGITKQFIVIGNKTLEVTREFTINEIALLSKTIKELQSEISKIEGDYIQDVKNENSLITQIILTDATRN